MLTEGNRNSDLGGEWSIEWTGGALKTNGFEGSKLLENVTERRRFRGCGVGLGCLGFAGGLGVLVRGSAASLGDFDLGLKLTRGFHLNGEGDGCTTGIHTTAKKPGSRPGREARIPMAVLAGEAGLLVGYGGCGCPGQRLGCAESLSGVPRVYDHSR